MRNCFISLQRLLKFDGTKHFLTNISRVNNKIDNIGYKNTTASDSIKTLFFGNRLYSFLSQSNLNKNKEVEHIINGIHLTIQDNSDIFKNETKQIPIVLIHGCYGNKRNFRSFSKLLKSNKIISLDLRNHGSSKHTNSMKYDNMEDDILNVLNELKIKKCCIVGFSLGGKVSMYLALKNNTIVSHLIIMDILPYNYLNENIQIKLPYNITYMTQVLYNIKRNKQPKTKNEFLIYLKTEIPNIPSSFVQFLCASLKETENKLNWNINIDTIYNELSHLMDFPLDANIYKYYNPCSFILAQKSDLAFSIPQYEYIIKNHFPTAKNFVLTNSSHTVYIDEPQECANIINKTLDL
ncbi:alpha/beta hydrolase, putative [Hepatocystis sp. ex Piliocolobus tephrosceles]|nr:alpha/beta hydrolase, putative [Hepatocystis sp. ex Piliocolobus tephrosceles]